MKTIFTLTPLGWISPDIKMSWNPKSLKSLLRKYNVRKVEIDKVSTNNQPTQVFLELGDGTVNDPDQFEEQVSW